MRVGLTGGVASGKSTVATMLAELGAVVIDADALAREVVEKGTPGLAAVVAEFGEQLLTPEGDLDRPAMGRLVFGDDAARKRLEAIVHPLVFERYAELEASAPAGALVVHDIPLLAESGRADGFDAVIVDEAQSLERNVLLTVLSRIGANSKVVLTHDVAQRDNLRVGRHDGVVAVIDKLKGHPLFAHVTLTRSERSPIAALVTEMLENVTL